MLRVRYTQVCDRCGKEFAMQEFKLHRWEFIPQPRGTRVYNLDTCDDCAEIVVEAMASALRTDYV